MSNYTLCFGSLDLRDVFSRLSLVGIGHHRICAKLLAKVYRKHFPIEATADGGACLFGLTACRLSAMQIVVCHERKSTPFLPTHWVKGFFGVVLVKSYTQSQIYTWRPSINYVVSRGEVVKNCQFYP